MNPTYIKYPSQRGVTLVISLLLLLILTLLGVTAMQTTILEEKMAGNMRNRNLAFQAAEAALRAGEKWLIEQTAEPIPQSNCNNPPCDLVWQIGTLNGGDFLNTQWWKTTDNVRTYGKDDTATAKNRDCSFSGVKTHLKTCPKYFIEAYALVKDNLNIGQAEDSVGRHVYRITARGTGGTDDAQAILQTTYARRF